MGWWNGVEEREGCGKAEVFVARVGPEEETPWMSSHGFRVWKWGLQSLWIEVFGEQRIIAHSHILYMFFFGVYKNKI